MLIRSISLSAIALKELKPPTIQEREKAAIGVFVTLEQATKDMVKEGVIVIDVGINRVDGKLFGDIDFEGVKEIAGAITPVPGGVGPMTVAMLLKNTLAAYKRNFKV